MPVAEQRHPELVHAAELVDLPFLYKAHCLDNLVGGKAVGGTPLIVGPHSEGHQREPVGVWACVGLAEIISVQIAIEAKQRELPWGA